MRRDALAVCSFALLAVAGCISMPGMSEHASMKLSFKQETMEAEVLKFISVGMSIDDAERIMKENGFKHDHVWSTPDVYICRAPIKLSWVTSDEIVVHIFYDNGVVTQIHVDCGAWAA